VEELVNKLWGVLALVAALFPFAVVGAKLTESESWITAVVFWAIVAVLFGVGLLASRITIERTLETEAVPRPPAPPIEWSWDGVNRSPGEDTE
jgi:hypothetical protein